MLEHRLTEALAVFGKMGIRIPDSGRHRRAIALLHKWNHSQTELDLTDTETLQRIEAAHRTAWEAFLIAVAAERHRRKWGNREDLFTSKRLSTMMAGPEIPEGKDTSARDAQFELYIGAEFEIAGLDVRGGEPDLRFKYGMELVGVAAKRVSSKVSTQLRRHLNKAVQQIEGSGLRGWIAVNIDTRFQGVNLDMEVTDLLTNFGSIFDDVHDTLEPHWENPAILGVLAFGYVTAWFPPEVKGDPLRLHIAQPFRWVRWSEDPSAELLHRDFTQGYTARLKTRQQILTSPEFQGVL